MLYPTIISKIICLLSLCILTTLSPVFSQTLDATFGNDGKVVTTINDSSSANSLVIQNDGKIIVAGSTVVGAKEYATLVRYNTDGTLDNTFGAAGKVVSLLPHIKRINAITIQQDGNIVASGTSNNSSTFNGDFTLMRYKMDGSADSLFGTNEIARVDMPGLGTIKKIIIKADGKILAGGTLGLPNFENIPALVQLKANGTADSSFGTNGKIANYIGNILGIDDMDFTKDGKIIATGEPKNFGNSDFALLRFSSNGKVDSAFGNNGVILTDFNNNSDDVSSALTVQPDSTIILAGRSYKTSIIQFALAKYHSNGTLDSSFGNGGKVLTSINNTPALATDVLLSADGSLIVSGYNFTGNNDFALTKYFLNGKPDSSFGTNGIVTTDFAGFADQSYASALQADGKIIVAGQGGTSSTKYSIALARYSIKVLPLKLLSFSASKDGKNNFLQWTTAQEIDVDRFEIERSRDGTNYSKIGMLNTGSGSYNFMDTEPFTGINYYRLKMIDRDGNFEYSMIRTVVNSGSIYISVYPLPVTNKLYVKIVSNEVDKADISVFDILGNKLLTNHVSLSAGVTNTSLNVQSLNKGVYFLKVTTAEVTKTRKIIVAK